MKCPYCGVIEDKVIDSRPTEEGYAIRRRRECISCTRRFTTYEKVEDLPLMVVKKDMSRQPFDREKLMAGLSKACEKRPISRLQLEAVVDEIEGKIYGLMHKEMSTTEIGAMIMEGLKKMDDVAYVRFASVYKQFTDVSSFMKELEKMISQEKKKEKG